MDSTGSVRYSVRALLGARVAACLPGSWLDRIELATLTFRRPSRPLHPSVGGGRLSPPDPRAGAPLVLPQVSALVRLADDRSGLWRGSDRSLVQPPTRLQARA
eukprot:9166403-Alexandrium_andersonii.AAC.1